MINKEISLSDVYDFFKKNNIPSFDEEIDEFGGYFITAARIAAIIIAPDPLTKIAIFCGSIDAASVRFSKLFNWLPDKFKYKEKGREVSAIKRYELSSYINYILLQIALKNGVKDIIMPALELNLKFITLEEDDKKELEKKCKDIDKERDLLNVRNFCSFTKDDVSVQASYLIEPIFTFLSNVLNKTIPIENVKIKIDFNTLKNNFIENVTNQYQAFLINFSTEFPEFTLWVNINQHEKIINYLKSIKDFDNIELRKIHEDFTSQVEKLVTNIKVLNENVFIDKNGFPTFLNNYKNIFQIHSEHISQIITGKTLENINAHQTFIIKELEKSLSANTDVDQIVYPKNKEIYVSQSYESINYKKKDHKKDFLTNDTLGNDCEKGENIGNYLLQCLVDPVYATKPIVLLGNPGAGKSMLSKMFAGMLCDTYDYIPFFIKLRSVSSSSANITEHINKGLSNSIANSYDCNWLDWAKEFKDRIPVIIMDGFDELMQTSNRELNGYIDAIKEFQDKALSNSVCVRFILTSRITVMQDVSIPEGTKIIKLDNFDEKRRQLWIKLWNDSQIKSNYQFAIPHDEKIEELAKEPLLLFMLAVYDFENSELQTMVNDNTFNQSKLYDSLLFKFIQRQLEKNSSYRNTNSIQKQKEEELFRFRLGMIALMMFLNDSTNRDTQKLTDEMNAFGLKNSTIQTQNVLGDFFFIHENKSITESDVQKYNYEFLHKTFGEFLAADFLLRITKKQYERIFNNNNETIAKKEIFNFCFGYNWLHKHYNILNFLFEHSINIFPLNNEFSPKIISNIIKTDLKELFEKGHFWFPVTEIRLQEKKSIIEHLGIYSQNLMFLWAALSKDNEAVLFDLFDNDKAQINFNTVPKYESQDREELLKNKIHWKRITKVWSLVGNNSATAKLLEWVEVSQDVQNIFFKKNKSNISHNFSDSSLVSLNDFEYILSFFDSENKISRKNSLLKEFDKITDNKPELTVLATEVVLHRFIDLFAIYKIKLIKWFKQKKITHKQQIQLLRKIKLLYIHFDFKVLNESFKLILNDKYFIFVDNIRAIIEYLKLIVQLKTYYPVKSFLDSEVIESIIHRLNKELSHVAAENPNVIFDLVKLINELNEHYPFRKRFRVDLIDDIIHRFSRDVHVYIKDNPYAAFDFLKILSQIERYIPIKKKVQPEIFDNVLFAISRDFRHISQQNPQFLFEFLKLVNDFNLDSYFDNHIYERFYLESLENISTNWKYLFRNNPANLFSYLTLISRLDEKYVHNLLVNNELLFETYFRTTEELIYLLRDSPKEGLKFIKSMTKYLGYLKLSDKRSVAFLEKLILQLSKEISFDKSRFDKELPLAYLELLIVFQNKIKSKKLYNHVEFQIESIVKSSLSNEFILKVSYLLIKYDTQKQMLELLLEKYPEIRSLLKTSTTLVQQVINSYLELMANEKNN